MNTELLLLVTKSSS